VGLTMPDRELRPGSDPDRLIAELKERAKELTCLYTVEELLADYDRPFGEILQAVVETIPPAWEFPAICSAHVMVRRQEAQTAGFEPSPIMLSESILSRGEEIGTIRVAYTAGAQTVPRQFLPEEEKLLHTIAQRIAGAVEHREMRDLVQEIDSFDSGDAPSPRGRYRWHTIVEFLLRTDQKLYARMARKMLTFLCWKGVTDCGRILADQGGTFLDQSAAETDQNVPQYLGITPDILEHSRRVFIAAERTLPERQIYTLLQTWIQEDKASFIFRTLVNLDHSLADVAEAVRRFVDLNPPEGLEVSEATRRGVQILLIRRMITSQLDYIRPAKRFLGVRDFYSLIERMIIPPRSYGVIGGKAAGLLLASRILEVRATDYPRLGTIKTPKTWYIPSDSLHLFMNYNDMEEMFEQKYKPLEEIRAEYPHIVRLFKSSRFPPEIVHGLSMALDDLGTEPIIVRSSSRLEDRFGSVFSGKYKSLFLVNRGSKQERLAALLDAVAEVYSSLFGPDPMQYRSERDLLDVREEMGVIIQQVVGTHVGPYYLPTCAGIVFSSNEFRWSPRIERTDGLLRLVPGLGTRAVDRLGDDYPVLVAPGRPGLRVNSTPDEIVKYSPRRMDVINLEERRFETIDTAAFLPEFGDALPAVERTVSVYADGNLTRKSRLALDLRRENGVFTFEGLLESEEFIGAIRDMVSVLEEELESPVDVEFAYDGESIWLLQCRPQSRSEETAPDPIPQNIPETETLFSARRHISNGSVPDIRYIVSVDPRRYGALESAERMRRVATAVGRLNRILPKRSFILIGPGRWGSRGDIRQGVSVTYADISNSAALVEVAVAGGEYMPDLSFGTHFFQDLVESSIRYIPVYPDDDDAVFNYKLPARMPNALEELLPEFADLAEVLRVIDVPAVREGAVLRILQNAEIDQAVAFFAAPREQAETTVSAPTVEVVTAVHSDEHWRWRYEMAERIAASLDRERFGVKGLYILGSTKNGTAGPSSDLDLIVHHDAEEDRLRELQLWMEGWSASLGEINYLRTGYRTGGLLDVHYITDRDIAEGNSFAIKIDAITDPAEPLDPGANGYRR